MLIIRIIEHYQHIVSVIRLSFQSVSKKTRRGGKLKDIYFLHVVLSLSGFLLIEQLMITDGTVAPLNRLRTIYAFGAAIALFVFGIGAAIVASRWYGSSSPADYQHSKSVCAE